MESTFVGEALEQAKARVNKARMECATEIEKQKYLGLKAVSGDIVVAVFRTDDGVIHRNKDSVETSIRNRHLQRSPTPTPLIDASSDFARFDCGGEVTWYLP